MFTTNCTFVRFADIACTFGKLIGNLPTNFHEITTHLHSGFASCLGKLSIFVCTNFDDSIAIKLSKYIQNYFFCDSFYLLSFSKR